MAPVTLTLTGVPLHTVVFVRDVASVGVAVTFTVIMVLLVQLPMVPVTVYVVVLLGLTLMVGVLTLPGNQA